MENKTLDNNDKNKKKENHQPNQVKSSSNSATTSIPNSIGNSMAISGGIPNDSFLDISNTNYTENKEINDSELLNEDKKNIIEYKNAKIEGLTELVTELIKENEILKENYAESVSFFKHYIELLESEIQSLKANQSTTTSVNVKEENIQSTKFGNFSKCEFCEEIIISNELKLHVDSMLNMKEIEYKIQNKDLDGLKESIKHGFNVNLIVNNQTQDSKYIFTI